MDRIKCLSTHAGSLMFIGLRDLIVIVPGIGGSTLTQNGHTAWACSMGLLWRLAKTWGGSFKSLALKNDPINEDVLGDGVVANGLVNVPSLISGLIASDGYDAIISKITDNFELQTPNQIGGNFFAFPYDWRRDNRVAARLLGRFVDERLDAWRASGGGSEARVIFITHSMGGLIARYYLECLQGWKKCRSLITLGTPHRGSPKALDFLVNGSKVGCFDLTDVMRTFTSLYQLLPIYPCIRVGDAEDLSRVTEAGAIPGLDPAKALEGLKFHHEIRDACQSNRQLDQYRTAGYTLIPFVGIHQPTRQSADFSNSRLSMRDVITLGGTMVIDGDGTVPRVSAIPLEMGDQYRETFMPERHACLQSNINMHDDLVARIEQMQSDVSAFRGGVSEVRSDAAAKTALRIDLPDHTLSDSILITAELLNAGNNPQTPVATVVHVESGEERVQGFVHSGSSWNAEIRALKPGMYRLRVALPTTGPADPTPVHDLFEVLDQTLA